MCVCVKTAHSPACAAGCLNLLLLRLKRWAREEGPDMDRIEDLYAMGVPRHQRGLGGQEFEGGHLPRGQGHGGHGPGGAHG